MVVPKHWTNAWLFLCFALFCLRLAFSYQEYSVQLFSFYFLTEYVFGFLLVAGCRSLSGNNDLRMRQELFVLPFIIVAFGLPFLADDFNFVFNVHSLILSGFFAIAFISLWRTKMKTFGWKVMLVALGLLVVDFFQYFLVFTLRQYVDIEAEYLSFNSVIDLVLQILLGFGMVIVLLEQVLTDAKIANEKLKKAHEKLAQELAHVDPLTTALNRHAFHGYLKRNGGVNRSMSGCVGFFDVDDLKTVNDNYGHGTGDAVIRTVVRAIREVIRAEDLIFRWGGDEFFCHSCRARFAGGIRADVPYRVAALKRPHRRRGQADDDRRFASFRRFLGSRRARKFDRQGSRRDDVPQQQQRKAAKNERSAIKQGTPGGGIVVHR